MACNCKTNQRLLELGLRYGTRGKTRKQILGQKTGNAFRSVFGLFFTVIVSPFIFIWLVCKGLFSKDKAVHFDKIFNLKKDDRKQQVIQG